MKRMLTSLVLLGVAQGAAAFPPDQAPGDATERRSPLTTGSMRAPAEVDILWYGGIDPGTGTAVPGGVWDFDDGTLQGWIGSDLTDIGTMWRYDAVEDTANVLLPQSEAMDGCWPGGAGYGNYWRQSLLIDGPAQVGFDYRTDSESYDITHVYVRDNVTGERVLLEEHSGSEQDANVETGTFGANIGTGHSLEILFTSDAIFSDALGVFSAHNCCYQDSRGAFHMSNMVPSSGWYAEAVAAGTSIRVEPLASLSPQPTLPSFAGHVLLASDPSAPEPHPRFQHEYLVSNPIVVPGSAAEYAGLVAEVDYFYDTAGLDATVWSSFGIQVYPWTCPETGAVGWSPLEAGFTDVGSESEGEGTIVHDFDWLGTDWGMTLAEVDSVRFAIHVVAVCDYAFGGGGVPLCDPEDTDLTNPAPYFDNIRVGFYVIDDYFSEATTPAVADTGDGKSVAWCDYDGDGDDDFYVANETEPHRLFRNDGGVFTDFSQFLPVGSGRAGVWGDFDLDGDPDLYVVRDGANSLYVNDGVFVQLTPNLLDDDGDGYAACSGDYDVDGDLDLFIANDSLGESRLLRNDGNGWVDVTPPELAVRATGGHWGDYDGDGDPDLIVGGPSSQGTGIVRNDGGGQFTRIFEGFSNGAFWADIDTDGDLDFVTGRSMRRNDGGDTFTFVALTNAITDHRTTAADFDLDGDLDLYSVSGIAPPGRLLINELWANVAPYTMVFYSEGAIADPRNGAASAWADYDADGDLDVYVVNDGDANVLLRNDQELVPRGMASDNWLALRPLTEHGAPAIGARVRVVAGGITRVREISGGAGNGSQDAPTTFFGLGEATSADSVVVTWPGSEPLVATDVAANRSILVAENALPVLVDVAVPPLDDPSSSRGVAWADVDGDGDDDLYVVNSDASNRMFRNDGEGWFTDVTMGPLGYTGSGSAAVFGDVDNDGDLDLYITNRNEANLLLRNDGNFTFTDITTGPLGNTDSSRSAAWADYDVDGDLDLCVTNSNAANVLLRNDDGSFIDVTTGALASPANSRAVAWGDVDDDGDPDLYVANASGASNLLLRNDGGDVFADVTGGPLGDTGESRGVSWGDYDNDGDLDLYLTNDGSPNRLLRNDGGLSFVDVASGALADAGGSRSAMWGDTDADGDLDLFLANADGANRLLRNDGLDAFSDGSIGDVGDVGVSNAVAWADHDQDGDLDLYVANEGTNQLLRNDQLTGHHWLQVDLAGQMSNRFGVGARIEVTSNGITQLREVATGSGYQSQSSLTAAFGLGGATTIQALHVAWPSGATTDTIPDVDQRIVLFEPVPRLTLDVSSIEVGLPPESHAATTLTLSNAPGATAIVWSLTATSGGARNGTTERGGSCPFLAISPTSGTISGGESQTLAITIDPPGLGVGEYSCTLAIDSNDATEPQREVPFTLVVQPGILPAQVDRVYVTNVGTIIGSLLGYLETSPDALVTIGGTGITGDVDGLAVSLTGEIYATSKDDTHLYRLDGGSGASVDLGALPVSAPLTGLAFDDAGALWGVASTTGDFYSVDPQSVDATLIGNVLPSFVVGLAFDHVQDRLLGTTPADFLTIDRTTGARSNFVLYQDGAFIQDLEVDASGDIHCVGPQVYYACSQGGNLVDEGVYPSAMLRGLASLPAPIAVDIPEPAVVETAYSLIPAAPNPFNPRTRIGFTLPEKGRARLDVFDTQGRRVRTLVDGAVPAGRHQVVFDGDRLGSGVYFYRLELPGLTTTRKMTLLK